MRLAVALAASLVALSSVACSSTAQPQRAVAAARPTAPAAARSTANRFEDCVEMVDVQRALNARNMAFQDCYADGLSRNPELRGTVTLDVVIPPSGEGRVRVADSTLDSDSVTSCIAEVASGLVFEQESCSVAQKVEYPVRLARGSSEFASIH